MNSSRASRGSPLVPAFLLWVLLMPESLAGAPNDPLAGDTIHAAGNALEEISLAFAGALASGSGERLATVFASGGIRLHLGDQGHVGLSSRQAVAAIREFLRGYEGGRAVVTRAAPIEGSPDRGFAEVLWSGRVSGTSQGVRRTLFVGLIRDAGQWRVDEVRFLR